MNFREWLFHAALDMPTGIRERVPAETLAHLEEAGALQAADVREVLGSPQRFNHELHHLCLTAKEWQSYGPRKGWPPAAWFTLVFWPVLLIWVQIKGTSASLTTMQVLTFSLLLIGIGMLAINTGKITLFEEDNGGIQW